MASPPGRCRTTVVRAALATALLCACSSKQYDWHPELVATKGELAPIVQRIRALGPLQAVDPPPESDGVLHMTNFRELSPFLGRQPEPWKQTAAAFRRDETTPYAFVLLALVKQGVAAELSTVIETSGVSVAQGAQAAVHAGNALAGIAQQVTDLAAQVAALVTPERQR